LPFDIDHLRLLRQSQTKDMWYWKASPGAQDGEVRSYLSVDTHSSELLLAHVDDMWFTRRQTNESSS
jgi:hypothetical protein